MGRRGGRCPHTLPIESTGQLDTHLVPRPSKHTQGLHTPLLADHKGVPPPPSERSTGSRHTSKSLSHTPLNSLGQVGVQLDTPPLPHPSGHIQGLHTHTLLAGHKGVPPPPSERSTGSRHTSKSLSHTPLNSLGQVGVQLDTPPLPHPSGHIQGLHTHTLLAGHKGVPPPPSERSTGSRHTSKSLSHTPLNSLGQVGVQLDTPPLPHPSGHIQGLHTHTLLAGHKGVPPPPSERSTGSRHTSKSLSHTPLNSLGQVGVQLDTPPLPHPSGHIQGLHTHPSSGHKGFPLLLRGL